MLPALLRCNERRLTPRRRVTHAGAAVCLHSLYTDPKETHSNLIRNLPFYSVYAAAMREHAATFARFPPKSTVNVQRSGVAAPAAAGGGARHRRRQA
jgi:hypothetical protein